MAVHPSPKRPASEKARSGGLRGSVEADLAGYERFLEHSERIYRVGFERLGQVPFSSAMDVARVVPAMMALESYRSVYELVAKYIENEKLRQVVIFHPLLVGGDTVVPDASALDRR